MSALTKFLRQASDSLERHQRLGAVLSYGFANALPSTASFILVLVYTKALTVGDYGSYNVLTALVTLVGVGVELGIPSGLLRDYFDRHRDDTAMIFLGSAIKEYATVSFLIAPFAVVLLVLAWPLPTSAIWPTVGMAVLVVFVSYFERLAEAFGAISRSIEYPRFFVIGRGVSAVCTIALAIVLVVGLHAGVIGALFARVIGSVATCLVYRSMMARGPGIKSGRFSWSHIKSFLAFGLPLVPNRVGVWVQQFGLKPILALVIPLPGVGLFSLAGSIAFMPLMLTSVFELALGPIYFKRRVDGTPTLHMKIRKLSIVMLAGEFAILSALVLFSPEAVRLIGGARYATAAPACALLASATLLRSMAPFFVRQIFFVRRTWLLPTLTLPCAAVTILIAIPLAGKLGFIAAAWAIIASEVALICGYAILVRRLEALQLPLLLLFGLFAALLSLAVLTTCPFWVHGIMASAFARALMLTAIIGVTYAIWIRPNTTFLRTLLAR